MQVSSRFSSTAAQSADIVSFRQKQMTLKDGQVSVEGTFLHYLVKTTDSDGNPRNEALDTVPREKKIQKENGKSWNESFKMHVLVKDFSGGSSAVERLEDPDTKRVSWRIRVSCIVIEGKDRKQGDEFRLYLAQNAAFAWSHDDPDSLYLRNFVTAEGVLLSHYWKEIQEDELITFTAPDREKKNIFRETAVPGSSVALVQSGAPLIFQNVEFVAFLSLGVEKNTSAEEEHEGATEEQKSKHIRATLQFQCKGNVVVGEDYDPLLDKAERLHMTKNRDVHNLIPIEQYRANDKLIPRHVYFYVSAGYQTPNEEGDPNKKRVTIMREQMPLEDSFKRGGATPSAWLKVAFDVFQFTGVEVEGLPFDQYNVVVIDNAKTNQDTTWRLLGVTDIDSYCALMMANRDIPLHIEAEPWAKIIKQNPNNEEKTIRNKPELEHMQGYYTMGMKSVVFDLLRYFRTRGIRVSPKWVEHDFRGSLFTNNRTGKSTLALRPLDPTKRNPVNAYGLWGAVLALGNGLMQTNPVNIEEEYAVNHAWEGNLLQLIEAGTHDFFVILSKPDVDDKFRGPNGIFADDYVQHLIDSEQVVYWIYAVRKDAKMAPDFIAPATTPKLNSEGKREREEQSESASSVSGTPSRRGRSRKTVKKEQQEESEH